MPPQSVESHSADSRGAGRASLYLAAALYCDGSPSPVKVRNISATGALVEAALLPTAGSMIQLVRGSLIVHGLVIWSEDCRCGLKFSGQIDVRAWRAAPGNPEQQRVDEVVQLVKAGAVPLPVPPFGEVIPPGGPGHANQLLPEDLRRASKLLDQLGNVLASDDGIITRCGALLQNLDIAMQVIAAVEAVMAGVTDLEIDPTKLAALRRSADLALDQGNAATALNESR